MKNVFPTPVKNYIPAVLREAIDVNGDLAGQALCDILDDHFEEVSAATNELQYIKWPERCPLAFLEALGDWVGAGITASDTEAVKRSKIAHAYEINMARGTWTDDIKKKIGRAHV